jgi:hypothetical protein
VILDLATRSKITTSPAAAKCSTKRCMYSRDLSRSDSHLQRRHAEHARAGPLGDRLDRAALAGRVVSFKHHDHP